MPMRKRTPATGLSAAFVVAHDAYRELPVDKRDGMLVRSLCDILLAEIRNPRCSWFDGGRACGKPAVMYDDERALCPKHTAALRRERQARLARDNARHKRNARAREAARRAQGEV